MIRLYFVTDDLGRLGRVWREADTEKTDLETVIQDLLTGHYFNPVRVVAFNTFERWSEDVSEDVAQAFSSRTTAWRLRSGTIMAACFR
jgi:hypothetical protein